MALLNIFSKNSDTHLLALDIGTEVVKALIVEVDHTEKKGYVVGVGRVPQALGNMQAGAVADIHGTVEAAREAIRIAKEAAGVKKVRSTIMGIAGELVKGTTTTVHYERVNPELAISWPEMQVIIRKVQEKAFERIQKQLSYETGQDRVDVKLINAAIVDVRIDGYRITNPLNFQGREVTLSVFNAYAPLIHLGALQSIADALNLDLKSVAAEPYAVARSVEIEDILDFSAIFIDVGGGTTDIAVVRNGALEGTKMFSLGGRGFTRRLAQEFKTTFAEAEEMKMSYAYGKLTESQAGGLARIFRDDILVWLSGVELALSEFSSTGTLPGKIFLCGGGSGLPGIRDALESSAWRRSLPFSDDIRVGYLQPKDVVKVLDETGELGNPQDITPLGLACLALADAVEDDRMLTSLLRRSLQ
jgi:cell division protein FtsA